MRRLIPVLLFSLVLFFSLAILMAWPTSAQEPDSLPPKDSDPLPATIPAESDLPSLGLDRTLLTKIEPPLLKKLLQSGSEPVPFIVYLNTTTDLAAATSALGSQNADDPLLRRTAIVNALQQTARNTQAGVLQILSSPPAGPSLSGQAQISAAGDIRPLWIVNAVAAKGSLDLVLTLAARPDVQVVRLDKEVRIGGGEDAKKRGREDARTRGNDIFTVPTLQPSNPPTLQPSNVPTLQSSPEWGIVKIRADLVHQALGITGEGVVVANIDTGVDWMHPALQTKYRGYTGPGKLPQHLGNWFDATGEGATYPIDGNGHGSHTMGTMVGDNGIGVAPGAKWIAAKAFNSSGGALNSWLHSAFQWMLAPNGNPALAPDLVNNSWGSDIGASTEFQADVQALLNAGIYPIFSAGNNGSDAGTVGSPGSLNITLAVGATDINDEVALFSSRGPSPWGKIKPEVAAPGKDIRSSLPGGAYGNLDGTSMAAPHVAGVVALMLQASPALSNNLSLISRVLTSTAVPLGSPIPNNDSGWGRIDAYNAVMAVGSFGTIQGTVTQGGLPVGGATLQIAPRSGGPIIYATTAANGTYLQGLGPDLYDVTASAFGYNPVTVFGLTVSNQTSLVQDFSLTRQPTGTLAGTVSETGTGQPLVASITIAGTPAQTTSGANGVYSLSLPEGTYTATVVAAAHRITQIVGLTINDGAVNTKNFSLDPVSRILLVDSGRWYQESEIGYYQQALTDLRYPYDTWSITQPFATPNDVPVTSTLTAYDIVIWSAPLDAPGYVGADAPLRGFLNQGGKLLISGQDVAFFDGGGSIFGSLPYFRNYLKAQFVEENSEVFSATGVITGPFAGLSLTFAGGDGANNQASPDVIENLNNDFGRNLLTYGNDSGLAGMYIGLCVPYRAVFLPFGFEAITSRTDRSQTLAQTLDWLLQPPTPTGVEVTPAEQTVVGNFGSVASHMVRVRNIGASPATFNLSLSSGTPYNWPVNPAPPSNLSLTACQAQTITIGVQVNVSNSWHVSDTRTLTVQSAGDLTISRTVTRTTKSPAPVLLVDDDRWYSFAAEYKTALEAKQIPYDYWLVPKSWSGTTPPSPPLETLQMYPMTIWYTAYDWYQPLLTTEEDRLTAYLNGGGRLLFSSQDYIYGLPNHKPSTFAQTYLGVLAHTEDYSSTAFIGQTGNPVGMALGPYSLTFPQGYNNWTDALTPTAAAQIVGVGQEGQPNSLANQGVGSGGRAWHTNFMSFGPEVMTPGDRARLLQRSLGWLSWLGASTVTPNISAATDGADISYTAILTNDGWSDLSTTIFTATFPAELTLGTASPEMSLVGGNLVWSGPLTRNTAKVLTYTANLPPSLPLGTTVDQVSWLAYPEHNLLFDRVARIKVNFPDLSGSSFAVTPPTGIVEGDVLSYTLTLKNDGLVDDPLITATNTLPAVLEMVEIDSPSQGALVTQGKSFTWTTALAKNQTATLTYRTLVSYTSSIIRNRVTIDDDLNDPLVLTAPAYFKVQTLYLPIIRKK